jgi:hypothetical protein
MTTIYVAFILFLFCFFFPLLLVVLAQTYLKLVGQF